MGEGCHLGKGLAPPGGTGGIRGGWCDLVSAIWEGFGAIWVGSARPQGLGVVQEIWRGPEWWRDLVQFLALS